MNGRSMSEATCWRSGGFAALSLALAYLVAIPYFLLVSAYTQAATAAEKVAVIVTEYSGMYAMTIVTYVLFGVVLGVLVLSLYERLLEGGGLRARVATAVGLTWSVALVLSGMVFNVGMGTVRSLAQSDPQQAAEAWQAIEPIADGLGGGGGEILGGLWMLLVSWIALRARILPRALAGFGGAVGIVGLVSTAPALRGAGLAFGLLQTAWFSWLGLVLLGGMRPSERRSMKRAALVVLAICSLAGSANAAEGLGGLRSAGVKSARYIRIEGLAVGSLFETRDVQGAISGKLGTVTYVSGRARLGLTCLDGYGRPKSMQEGDSVIEMLCPIHVGFNLMAGPEPRWRLYGMRGDLYAEVVVGFWNQSDARYKYHPNTRLALSSGIASHGLGARAELGYISGRDALYASLQLRLLTFDIGV